jgi:hypothetical protein
MRARQGEGSSVMIGLKTYLQPPKMLATPIVAAPDMAMRRVCREFVDNCSSRGSLDGLVEDLLLTDPQVQHVYAAKTTSEWALRLWSFLARLNWTDLHRVGPHLPSPLKEWWTEWIKDYTKTCVPREGRFYVDATSDPK